MSSFDLLSAHISSSVHMLARDSVVVFQSQGRGGNSGGFKGFWCFFYYTDVTVGVVNILVVCEITTMHLC